MSKGRLCLVGGALPGSHAVSGAGMEALCASWCLMAAVAARLLQCTRLVGGTTANLKLACAILPCRTDGKEFVDDD